MIEVYPSKDEFSSIGDKQSLTNKRKELHLLRESRMVRKLKKEMERMTKQELSVKAGLILPDKTGEHEIKREFEWWEEEMKHREVIRAQQIERERQHAAELDELQTKEQKLSDFKGAWQIKKEGIALEEEDLQKIQKEFEDKVQLQLRASSSHEGETSRVVRMKEETERRALKKALREGDGSLSDSKQQAKYTLLQHIEEKAELERSIVLLQKEVGLMRQRISGREKSHVKNMDEARRRKLENYEPRELPPLEELYAPRVPPPKQLVLCSHLARLEEAKLAKEARRAKLLTQRGNKGIKNNGSSSKAPGTSNS